MEDQLKRENQKERRRKTAFLPDGIMIFFNSIEEWKRLFGEVDSSERAAESGCTRVG